MSVDLPVFANQFTVNAMRKTLAIVGLLFVVGCLPPAAQPEVDAAQAAAACIVRIQTECKPLPNGKKDRACPAYVECKKYADEFEGAK